MKFKNFKRNFVNEDGDKKKQFKKERESKDFTKFIKTGGKIDIDVLQDLEDEYDSHRRR